MRALINQINLGFESLGKNGIPIVLIHGFGLDRSIWKDMVSCCMGEANVILPDLRGHGESDVTGGMYSMSLLAADIVGLLDHLGIEKAIVCGHSMGGYVTLAIADQYPDRLAGLGLITSKAEGDSTDKRSGRYALVQAVREKGSTALAESLAPRISKYPDVIEKSAQIINNTNPHGIVGSALGMAERPDRTELLSQIICPVLVLAGEQDQLIPLYYAQEMANQLPNVHFVTIKGAGHMPMVECPEITAMSLLALRDEVEKQHVR
jgi:pimeloyl-ACP methyl ester carboxylesterase